MGDQQSLIADRGEASYFNYFLNKAEFSNGPGLRWVWCGVGQQTGELERRRGAIRGANCPIPMRISGTGDRFLATNHA
jgi:hypothetical protein